VKRLGGFAIAALLVLYPLAIYFGLQFLQPRLLGLLLALLVALRAWLVRDRLRTAGAQLYPVIVMGGACALLAMLFNSAASLRLLPVAINAVFFLSFALTLRWPPSMIERFARIMHPDLSAHGVAYTRRVTQIWCGFFIVNGGIALYTALAGSAALWLLYNGLLAYVLMGLLFAAEYLVRLRVMRGAARV
jgi:uncharacterized membrane protein